MGAATRPSCASAWMRSSTRSSSRRPRLPRASRTSPFRRMSPCTPSSTSSDATVLGGVRIRSACCLRLVGCWGDWCVAGVLIFLLVPRYHLLLLLVPRYHLLLLHLVVLLLAHSYDVANLSELVPYLLLLELSSVVVQYNMLL